MDEIYTDGTDSVRLSFFILIYKTKNEIQTSNDLKDKKKLKQIYDQLTQINKLQVIKVITKLQLPNYKI